ncbi:hypothetical protein V8F33_005125 [Rhypophila sp. PSN 637]
MDAFRKQMKKNGPLPNNTKEDLSWIQQDVNELTELSKSSKSSMAPKTEVTGMAPRTEVTAPTGKAIPPPKPLFSKLHMRAKKAFLEEFEADFAKRCAPDWHDKSTARVKDWGTPAWLERQKRREEARAKAREEEEREDTEEYAAERAEKKAQEKSKIEKGGEKMNLRGGLVQKSFRDDPESDGEVADSGEDADGEMETASETGSPNSNDTVAWSTNISPAREDPFN